MRVWRMLSAVVWCLLASACSAEVTLPGTGGSGGDAGSSTASGGGAGGAEMCGGKQGLTCDFSSWCDYPEESSCGCCDMTGVCVPRPLECTKDCPGACGCDGVFYCSECLANLAGVDVDPLAICTSSGEYSVRMLPTDVPRFVLFKADASRDLCVRILVAAFGGPGRFDVEVTPSWQIEDIAVTNRFADCQLGAAGVLDPPLDQSANATAAVGVIVVDLPDVPCGVTADATLYFDPLAPWIPAQEPFDSGYLSTGVPCDL